ncbi:MAG: HAD family hydrolase [Clostridia bacterium]|nr:HAD family hydrolase [Clostridia bacterium]
MKYNCIIWDWNGTLLDDVSASLRSVNDMLVKRGKPPIDIDRYRECIGVPIKHFYEQVFEIEKEDYSLLLKEYNEGYEYYVNLDCGIADGAVGLLEEIKQAGAKQIIVSSCEKNQLFAAVKKSGVGGYFDAVLGADDYFATSKIDRARDYLKNNLPEKSKLLAVGDLLHDYQLAAELGADCVLVKSGHEDTGRLLASGAFTADNVADVKRFIFG